MEAYYEKEEYDEDGKLMACTNYNSMHKMKNMTRYEYNESGLKSKETYFDEEGHLVYEYTYFYNSDGRLEKCVKESNEASSITYTENYEYDAKGNLIKKTTYDEYGNMNGYPTEYKYDKYGNMVSG